MSNKFQLQVPEPCHENWDQMSPVDQGRFCNSCQKAVIDFTGMNDAQLIAYFKKPSTGSLCGRFNNDQLDREFNIPRKRLRWIKYFFQFTIPVFLAGMKSQAQAQLVLRDKVAPATIITCSKTIGDTNIILGNLVPANTIAGKVSDEKGNGIPYASVSVKGSTQGTVCDSAGLFTLNVSSYQKTLELVGSSVGFSSGVKEVKLQKTDWVEIKLKARGGLSGEVVVVGYGSIRKGMVMGSMTTTRRSWVQKVKDYFTPDSIHVFPNPAKAGDEIKVKWKRMTAGDHIIELYNLKSQLIKSIAVKVSPETNFIDFRLPSITPGAYIVIVTNKNIGKKYSEKIIVQ